MSSQGHLRYPQQPPPSSSANDFRLPSLKDLNFQYRPLPVTNTHEHATEQTQQYTDFVPQDQPANSSSSNSNNNNNNNNNTTTTNNNSNGGSNTFAYSYPSYQAHASPWSPPSSTNRTTPLVPTTLPHYHASNTDASPPARPDARIPPAYVPSIAAATRPHPASPDSRYSQHPAESRYPSAHAQEPRYHAQPPPSADSRPTTGYSTTTELKPTLISSTPAAATDSRTSYDQNARSAYDQLGRTSFEQNGRSSYEANRVGYEQPARPTYDQNTRVAYEQSPRSGYDPVPRSNTGYDTTNARPPAVRTNNSPQGYIPANTRTPHESSRPAFAPPSGDITRAPSELQRAYVSPVDLRQYPPAQSRQTYPAAEARSAYPAADARSGYPPADVRPTYALPETRIAYPAADARPVYTADGRIADARPVYSPVATSAPEQRSRHGNGNSQEHLHPERYAPPQAVTQDKHAPQPLQPSERYPGPHSQSQPQERYAPQQADRYASQQPDRYVQHQQHSDKYALQPPLPQERYTPQQQPHESRSAHPHPEQREEIPPSANHVSQHTASHSHAHPQSHHPQSQAHYPPGYAAPAPPTHHHAHATQLSPTHSHISQIHPQPHLQTQHSHSQNSQPHPHSQNPPSHPHPHPQSQSQSQQHHSHFPHPHPQPHSHSTQPHSHSTQPPSHSHQQSSAPPHSQVPSANSHQSQQTQLSHAVARPEPAPETEKDIVVREVVRHCTTLYNFAARYANLQTTVPSIQPTQSELAEMTHHAAEVVRLLELLKDERPSSYALPQIPQAQPHPLSGQIQPSTSPQAMDVDTHDHRAPKRPWEEDAPEAVDSKRAHSTVHDPAALQDMELIRSKRALTASLAAAAASGDGIGGPSSANGGNNANVGSDGGLGNGNMSGNGGGKNKYRKRSRATPPGKCHSCNIRETPEWRRGPDGARTLCNACGLHYAKLVRKRDKAAAADGNAPARIDMETLRASARAAESEKAARSGSGGGGGDPMMGMGMVHQGSFQIMGMGTGGPEGDHHAQYPNSTTQPQPQPPAALPSHHVSDHPHPSLPAWTGSHSLLRASHSVSASSGPSPA